MDRCEQERAVIEGLKQELVTAFPRMDSRLRNALAERGHGAEQVRAMSPQSRFNEFCEWEGLLGWAAKLLNIARSAGVVVNATPYSVIPVRKTGDGWEQCLAEQAERFELYELDSGEAVLVGTPSTQLDADQRVEAAERVRREKATVGHAVH